MSGKSNYLEDKVLGWALKGQAMGTAPTTVYVGLFDGDPLDTGAGGSEVTTTIRAAGRVAATFGSITTQAGANLISNDAIVDFGDADGAADITHFGVFDASSGGNMLYSAALAGGEENIASGNLVSFPIGALDISED